MSGPSYAQSFQLNSDGSFDYTPNANWAGNDSFVYRATNGGGSDTATVTLTVTNVAPVANADSYTLWYDQLDTASQGLAGVLANDSDQDSDPLTAVLVQTTTYGTLSLGPTAISSTRPIRSAGRAPIRSPTRPRTASPRAPRPRSASR